MTSRDEEPIDTSHLDDVADGCGCTEIWEHMSEERDSNDEDCCAVRPRHGGETLFTPLSLSLSDDR